MKIITVNPPPPPTPEPTYTIAGLTRQELEAIQDALGDSIHSSKWHLNYRVFLRQVLNKLNEQWPAKNA